ncbi:dynamin family protein [Hirsutella rhossiliensis]|uniref:Dynamin family domain-containing protein n=1 Tax=Hirsutella rhossiliensis TaxID=111463 RepID=A0A9P8SKF2_9HYPO|nr:dynamin family domain-containing protein [Hirsutella rhossiliensis]KAH0964685.1 dynamin family domain-containing protein [Hirsutella rhossiliensis]
MESQPEVLYAQGERVTKKESAVQKAIASLLALANLVGKIPNPSSGLDLPTWKFLVDAVAQDSDAFKFLVGVAGDTGIGKSSLLNALVSETADIAPSSQNGACTAAVCCFSHPGSGSASPLTYTARVYLKSKDTVDQELNAFFQEYNEFEERVQLAGGEDSITYGEREKLNDQINIIRGWSGLSKQQLEEFGLNHQVSEITSSCTNKEQLFELKDHQRGKVVQLADKDSRKFLHAIKPYVGNAGRTPGLINIRWPLVEKVEIFVEADLLRGGIALVDLPGEMDALDARSQVARRYYNKLDSLMVVTPGDRAIDNKTAMEIIRDDQIMDMEADGMIHENGLCVVVSKVDLMDWRNFVETEYSSQEISADFEHLDQNLRIKEGEKLALARRIVDLETGDGDTDGELGSLIHLKNRVAEEIIQLDSLCLRRCIDARNKDIRTAFEHYFNRIRNSTRAKKAAEVSTGLNVISVSSKAHRSLARGRPEAAFHEAESTGIGALKDWIIKSSLQKREEHADTVLHRCQVLFDAIDDWATEEPHVMVILPETERTEIKKILGKERARLKMSLRSMVQNFGNSVDKLLSEAALSNIESGNENFSKRFVPHVDDYQKAGSDGKLHWSTYAACIRRRGGAFRTSGRPRKTHCWQARTYYGLLWKGHAHKWGQAYGQTLEEKTKKLDGRLQMRFGLHIKKTTEAEGLPVGFRTALRSCAYRIENIFTDYRYQVRKAVREHREIARVNKQRSRDLLAGKMNEAYVLADSITGKGKLKRQVATMNKFAEEMKETIFTDISHKVDDKLREKRADLRNKLKTETTKVVNEIGKIEERDVVSQQVKEWKQYWNHLRARFPRVEVVIDDDSVGSDDESEDNGTRPAKKTTAKKRAKKAAGDGPRKALKKKGGKKAKEAEDKTFAETPSTSAQQPSAIRHVRFKTEPDEHQDGWAGCGFS